MAYAPNKLCYVPESGVWCASASPDIQIFDDVVRHTHTHPPFNRLICVVRLTCATGRADQQLEGTHRQGSVALPLGVKVNRVLWRLRQYVQYIVSLRVDLERAFSYYICMASINVELHCRDQGAA